MTLKEFREFTKDLPDSAVIYVLAGNAWRSPSSLKTHTESLLYVEGYAEVPESLKNRVEIQMDFGDS
jgi:hypothetical protein